MEFPTATDGRAKLKLRPFSPARSKRASDISIRRRAYAGAETLIGRHLPSGHRLKIVTKLPIIAEDAIDARHTKSMLTALAASLERLRSAQVHGVLDPHHARDLAKLGLAAPGRCAGGGARARLDVAHRRFRSMTRAISPWLKAVLTPDLIQLPFNALDHRLAASGLVSPRLKASGRSRCMRVHCSCKGCC